ncbi:MAG TPA: DoxX family protein [Chitinophagaceae bacterium]|nr:DoxX family protein [Chitinophagaceae bacterium]
MSIVKRLDDWSDQHRIKWVLILRVALGILLLFKGLSFISHTEDLEKIIAESNLKSGGQALAMYVTFAHLLGGVLIIVGLLTRLAVIIQLPVLIGAIFFVNAAHGFMNVNSQLGLSILVLLLLIFFLFEGGGPYSMDRYIKKKLL